MGLVTKPNTFSAGAIIVASEHNDNYNTIYNEFNGNIDNANIKAAAAIVDTKLAAITSGGKVNFTALTTTSEAGGNAVSHDGTNWARVATPDSRYRVLMNMGSTSAASFQQINLVSAHSITGALPVANGGTGITNRSAIASAWVNFNGYTTAIGTGNMTGVNGYYNITAVRRFAVGTYGIYWNTPFANSSYAISGLAYRGTGNVGFVRIAKGLTTTSCNAITLTDAGSTEDSHIVTLMAFGLQ